MVLIKNDQKSGSEGRANRFAYLRMKRSPASLGAFAILAGQEKAAGTDSRLTQAPQTP